MTMPMFLRGRFITVKAYKSDGEWYRSWEAEVESAQEAEIVTFTPVGNLVIAPDRSYVVEHAMRSYYWPGKPYNLLEVYHPDLSLHEIYIHLASPPVLDGSLLQYVDWELDVIRYPGGEAFIVDEDEFEAASSQYTYTVEFRAACYRVVGQAMALANTWVPQGIRSSSR
jgi:uncharacterized protein